MAGWVWLLLGVLLGLVGAAVWFVIWLIRNNPWKQR